MFPKERILALGEALILIVRAMSSIEEAFNTRVQAPEDEA